MHKILAAAAALGLFALPLQTSAQTTNQPAANKDAANPAASTKNTTTANTTKKASTNKHTLKRKTQASKTKRLAKHGRKPHYAKAMRLPCVSRASLLRFYRHQEQAASSPSPGQLRVCT